MNLNFIKIMMLDFRYLMPDKLHPTLVIFLSLSGIWYPASGIPGQ